MQPQHASEFGDGRAVETVKASATKIASADRPADGIVSSTAPAPLDSATVSRTRALLVGFDGAPRRRNCRDEAGPGRLAEPAARVDDSAAESRLRRDLLRPRRNAPRIAYSGRSRMYSPRSPQLTITQKICQGK